MLCAGLNRQHQEYRSRDQNELKQSRTETLRDIATSRVAEDNMAQELSQKRTRDARIEKSLSAADVSISAKKEGLRGMGRKAGRDMVSVQLGLKNNLDQIRLLETAKREVHNNMMETRYALFNLICSYCWLNGMHSFLKALSTAWTSLISRKKPA